MRSNNAKQIALSGMLAALAVVIMCLGGIIPVATYACPMLCCMTQYVVLRFCGKKLAWTWFAVVSILVLLLGPDKEAAVIFLAIGYYPLIKHTLDVCKLGLFIKALYFNASVFTAYAILIYVMGMQDLLSENMELGIAGLILILCMGNLTFFLLDRLLTIMKGKLRS